MKSKHRQRSRKMRAQSQIQLQNQAWSRALNAFRNISGRTFAAVGFVAALIAFLVLFPWLSIDEGMSFDSYNPYRTPFFISNEGYLPIQHLTAECFFNFHRSIPHSKVDARGNTVHIDNFAPALHYKHRVTVPCFHSFEVSRIDSGATLRITVFYSLLGVPHMHQSFDFQAETAPDGSYRWLYKG